MKKISLITIGLGAGIVALIVLGRLWRAEPSGDRVGRRELRGGAASGGEPEPYTGGGQPNAGTHGRSRSAPNGDDTHAGGGRLGGVVGGASTRQQRRGDTNAGGTDPRAPRQLERGARTTDDPLPRPNLPAAAAPDSGNSGDTGDEPTDEPLPDVAYDAGDKVFDTGNQVEIPDAAIAGPDAGSISLWLEPQWADGTADNASFVRLGDGGLRLVKDGTTLRFEYVDATGAVQGGGADISDWHAGDWRHVVATWKDGSLSLFIDAGQLFLNHAANPPSSPAGSIVYFGSAPSNGDPVAPAQISGAQLWNHDLSAAEVRQLFETGGQRTP